MKTQQKGLHMVSVGDLAVAELYGSQICCLNRTQKLLTLAHCGWTTNSTARALNTFFEQYGVRGRAYRRGDNVYVDIGTVTGFALAATPTFFDLSPKDLGLEVGNA